VPSLNAPTWEQVSQLLQSLGSFQWAIVAVIVYFLIRNHIAEIVSRLKSAKLGAASFELFQKSYDSLEKGTEGATLSSGVVEVQATGIVVESDVENVDQTPQEGEASPPPTTKGVPIETLTTRRLSYEDIAQKVLNVSASSESAAILLLSEYIEDELRRMVLASEPEPLLQPVRYLRSIERLSSVLASRGLITEETLANLINFAEIRNFVRQNRDQLSTAQVIGAISLGLKLLKSILPG
jgi:hypothetical protein